MKPYTRSIIGLFDGKRRYLVPLYQRQYSWRDDPQLVIEGVDGKHASFPSASRAVTSTSRNGWNDWYIAIADGGWMLAADWRHIATFDE